MHPDEDVTAVPMAEAFGDGGEWLLIEGHHDPDEAALQMLRAHADLYSWPDATDLLEQGWRAYRSSVQAIYWTWHPSDEWASLHVRPNEHSRPVMVLSLEDNTITEADPQWPEWLNERHPEHAQFGSTASPQPGTPAEGER